MELLHLNHTAFHALSQMSVVISTILNIQEFAFFRLAYFTFSQVTINLSCVKEHTATIGVNGLFNRLQGTVIAP